MSLLVALKLYVYYATSVCVGAAHVEQNGTLPESASGHTLIL